MSFDDGVHRLLALVSARSSGRAGDEDVEKAVSELLGSPAEGGGGGGGGRASSTGAAAAPSASSRLRRPTPKSPVMDKGKYDDDSDDDDKRSKGVSHKRGVARRSGGSRASSPPPPATTPPRGRKRGRRASTAESRKVPLDENHWERLGAIPLGRQGAKMMVTFGDGRKPDPGAVEEALLGTRKCLQCAIRDARSRRRRDRESYLSARQKAASYSSRPPSGAAELRSSAADAGGSGGGGCPDVVVNVESAFKAMAGYNILSVDLPAGFDVGQLEALFPEEMRSYQRWRRMQRAYAKKAADQDEMEAAGGDEANNNDAEDEDEADDGTEPRGVDGGHLNDRLARFDARTTKMKSGWYLTFSEVRQGSFLPRSSRQGGKGGGSNGDLTHKKRGAVNRRQINTWEDLPPASARFLHWIGFDPTSALPPPDDESAQALAFLGYDFLGKIVERAILLRRITSDEDKKDGNSKKKKGKKTTRDKSKPTKAEKKSPPRKGRRKLPPEASESDSEDENDDDNDEFVLEMRGGDQLNVEDIHRAMQDSTVAPEPLYRAAGETESESKPQLYFGPGFEDRLEVELEEIVLGKKKAAELSEQEREFRRNEEELFASIQGPPVGLAEGNTAAATGIGDCDATNEDDVAAKSAPLSDKSPVKGGGEREKQSADKVTNKTSPKRKGVTPRAQKNTSPARGGGNIKKKQPAPKVRKKEAIAKETTASPLSSPARKKTKWNEDRPVRACTQHATRSRSS